MSRVAHVQREDENLPCWDPAHADGENQSSPRQLRRTCCGRKASSPRNAVSIFSLMRSNVNGSNGPLRMSLGPRRSSKVWHCARVPRIDEHSHGRAPRRRPGRERHMSRSTPPLPHPPGAANRRQAARNQRSAADAASSTPLATPPATRRPLDRLNTPRGQRVRAWLGRRPSFYRRGRPWSCA